MVLTFLSRLIVCIELKFGFEALSPIYFKTHDSQQIYKTSVTLQLVYRSFRFNYKDFHTRVHSALYSSIADSVSCYYWCCF